jgi:uncharacterized Fe-S cluster-containing MiaB family protein
MTEKFITTRYLPESENYSGRAIQKGEIVFRYRGCTYGCISSEGVACTFAPDVEPFFEIPSDAIRIVLQ